MSPRKNFRFIGNLGADPELKTTSNGRSYCRFSICVNTRWKNKNTGETETNSEWFSLVIWGKPSETFQKIAKKGALIAVDGIPTAGSVTDPESGKTYQTPGFSVNSFEILKYPNSDQQNSEYSQGNNKSSQSSSSSSGSSVIQEDSQSNEEEIDYSLDVDGEDNSFEDIIESDSDEEIPF